MSGYKTTYALFKDLTEKEVITFEASAHDIMTEGDCYSVNTYPIDIIHPVVRKEMIKIIEESLRKQGEL